MIGAWPIKLWLKLKGTKRGPNFVGKGDVKEDIKRGRKRGHKRELNNLPMIGAWPIALWLKLKGNQK